MIIEKRIILKIDKLQASMNNVIEKISHLKYTKEERSSAIRCLCISGKCILERDFGEDYLTKTEVLCYMEKKDGILYNFLRKQVGVK